MILVTGAGGFLGTHLIEYFRKSGVDLMPLYYAQEPAVHHDAWYADLSQPSHVEYLIRTTQAPQTIIHLAGYIDIALLPNPDGVEKPPIAGIQNNALLRAGNVMTTENIMHYALEKKIKNFIFSSSQSVYGTPAEKILTEDSPCGPLETYAATKLEAEQFLEKIAQQNIMDVAVLRMPGLYGESRLSGAVYSMCKNALLNKKIEVTIPYPLPFDVIHIDDVVQAIYKLLSLKDYNFLRLNISTGQGCSLDILADAVAGVVGNCQVVHAPVQQPVVTMDNVKARQLLSWQPTPLKEHLINMLERIQHA